jgi:hypothetical protein
MGSCAARCNAVSGSLASCGVGRTARSSVMCAKTSSGTRVRRTGRYASKMGHRRQNMSEARILDCNHHGCGRHNSPHPSNSPGRVKIVVSRKSLVHGIANCLDCDWTCEDYSCVRRKAREHVAKTAHHVSMELAYGVQISANNFM